MGAGYCMLRDQIDELEAQLSQKKEALDAHVQLIIGWMEEAGLTKYRLESGDSLAVTDKPYCQVVDKDRWLTWIHETGQDDLLSVHYQTMNGMVSARLQDGRDLPPGIKAYIKSSITRYKPRS